MAWYSSTLFSSSVSAVTAATRSAGSAAKAALVGAKMVKGPGPVRVSASPALTASSTRVEAPFLCSSSTMLPASTCLAMGGGEKQEVAATRDKRTVTSIVRVLVVVTVIL